MINTTRRNYTSYILLKTKPIFSFADAPAAIAESILEVSRLMKISNPSAFNLKKHLLQ
jgi:hypothetical protein